jgi:UDP-2-acetamido-3-amino-2,3-dideoxy-glucuronate N-acetyltransferase
MIEQTKIAVIGCGMWGRNIIRNAAALGALAAVIDTDNMRASDFAKQFNCDALSLQEALQRDDISGFMIATDATTHCDIATTALQAGKHVFIEKPMAMSLAEAKTIKAQADSQNKQVMIGHLIRYHPVFQALEAEVKQGRIGTIRHIQANRLAMGRIRSTESVLYDLCPHDLSLILALTGSAPHQVFCHGLSHMTAGLADFLSTSLIFKGGITASMHTSWLSPIKEHRLTVTGTTGSLVFDDTQTWAEKLCLYRDHIEQDGTYFKIERKQPEFIAVRQDEPLKSEVSTFISTCQTGRPAPTNAAEGVRVQSVLEQMSATFEGVK